MPGNGPKKPSDDFADVMEYMKVVGTLPSPVKSSANTATEVIMKMQQRMAEMEAAMAVPKFMVTQPDQIMQDQSGITTVFKPKPNMQTFGPSAEEMLGMRLRFKDGAMMPFQHLSAFLSDEVAVVMVVTNGGKPVMIEDDPNLFPSDALVGQLRMLYLVNEDKK